MRVLKNRFIGNLASVLALTLGFSLTSISGQVAPAVAGSAQRGEVCATGGECAVGDVGPGGGIIVYINQNNPVISSTFTEGQATVKTTYAHLLTAGETVTLTALAPHAFTSNLLVTEVPSSTEFVVASANQAAADLLAFGYIPKQAGWDLLQAAPAGWSGQAIDPTAAIATGIQANDVRDGWITKASIGAGRANTNNLLAATIADEAIDAASIIESYGSEWFLPSASEMKVAGNVLAATPELAITNSVSEIYETSTLQTESQASCEASNVAVWFRDAKLVGVNYRCENYSIRPVRQILNRVWLNPNINDQLSFAVRTYEVGGEVTLPRIANYGASLDFWSTAPYSGTSAVGDGGVTSLTKVAAGALLYAYWSGTSGYEIAFDGNGSTSGQVSSITWGIATLPVDLPSGDTLSKPGNTFAGWSETINGPVISGPYEPPYSLTLYARWSPVSCSVNFASEGAISGDAPQSITNSKGTSFSLPLVTDLVKPGYRVTGWSLTSGGTSDVKPYFCSSENSDITLYPIWSLGTYNLVFSGNGNTGGGSPQTLTYTTNALGTLIPSAGSLVRTGYTFGGWSDGTRAVSAGSRYQTDRDVTFSAVWNPLTYTVRFAIGDSATGVAPSQVPYVVGTEALSLPNASGFSRTGFEFLGWSFSPESKFETQALVVDPFTPRATRTLFAVWAQQASSCATNGFCLPGDVAASGGKVFYVNQDLEISSILTGNDQAIYRTAQKNNLQVGDLVTIKGSVPSAFNVTATVERIDSDYDFLISLPLLEPATYISGGYIAKKAGWDYLELAPATWNLTANSEDLQRKYAYGPNLALNRNQIGDGFANTEAYLTATIDESSTDPGSLIKQYGSEWYLPSDREMLQAGSVLARTKSDALANAFADYYATSTTYVLGGGLETLRGLYFTACLPESDACNFSTSVYYYDTYFAYRPVRQVKIRAILDPNFSRSALTVVKGYVGSTDASYAMPSPVRPGYTFAGWYDQATGGNLVALATVALTDAMVANSKTLFAHWTENSISVTFEGTGKTAGEAPATINWLESTGPIALGAGTLVKTGHTLAGWSETLNGALVPSDYSPSAAVKLFAKWTPNVYTVSFVSQNQSGGSIPTDLTYTYGQPALAIPSGNLVRTGYKFKGWSRTENGSVIGSTYTPVADTTLFAVWEAKKVRSNFRLPSSLKRSKSTSNIALVTAEKTAIVVRAVGRCSVASVKSGRKIIARKITASGTKGICTVTITVAENSTYASFSQVTRITVN